MLPERERDASSKLYASRTCAFDTFQSFGESQSEFRGIEFGMTQLDCSLALCHNSS